MTSKRKKYGQENVMARRINEKIYGEGKKTTFFFALWLITSTSFYP